MLIMKLNKIKVSFGEKTVLEDINLSVKEHARMGLVGRNGSGKTTLAKIMAGILRQDEGTIETFNQKLNIGYLKQSTEFNENIFQDLLYDAQKNPSELLKVSSQIGIKDLVHWSGERLDHLSGGEKTKLSLTEVFNTAFDLLILDEPTNHLDYIGVEWLIASIKNYVGALIIISHDRYFLDQVADEIAEIEDGSIKMYPGNYTSYQTQKKAEFESQLHQYETQKRKEQKLKEDIKQLQQWSDKAQRESTKKEGFKEYWRVKAKKKDKQVKSKIKRLEKMLDEGNEKPKQVVPLSFAFSMEGKTGKNVLRAENVSKKYDQKYLFQASHFYIKRGEKVGLIGVNGSGKTTLIKMILGYDQDYEGQLSISPNLKIAYLSQDVFDLDESKSLDELICEFTKEEQTNIRTFLASNHIPPRTIYQKINTLSLGERTRIKLIFLVVQGNHLLILDEPTNHLDLESREQLEKTLQDYPGTIILASHDRYLMEHVTDKILVFENGKINRYEFGYQEYLRVKKPNNDCKNQLSIIQNQITYLLAELNKYSPTNPIYQELDQKFNELIKIRSELEKNCNK